MASFANASAVFMNHHRAIERTTRKISSLALLLGFVTALVATPLGGASALFGITIVLMVAFFGLLVVSASLSSRNRWEAITERWACYVLATYLSHVVMGVFLLVCTR